MTIFKTYKFTWWQVAILKVATVSLGIIIGVSFAEIFTPLVPFLWILAIACGFYLVYTYLVKQK